MFKLSNLDDIIRGHSLFLAKNERMVHEESASAAKHALHHVASYPEFKPRTGRLQRMTKAKSIKIKGGSRIRLTNNLPYAQAIDTGAKPHVIKARNAPYLRFKTKSGKWVTAKKVNHPGNRPYKFGFKAINSAHRMMGVQLRQTMTRLAKAF